MIRQLKYFISISYLLYFIYIFQLNATQKIQGIDLTHLEIFKIGFESTVVRVLLFIVTLRIIVNMSFLSILILFLFISGFCLVNLLNALLNSNFNDFFYYLGNLTCTVVLPTSFFIIGRIQIAIFYSKIIKFYKHADDETLKFIYEQGDLVWDGLSYIYLSRDKENLNDASYWNINIKISYQYYSKYLDVLKYIHSKDFIRRISNEFFNSEFGFYLFDTFSKIMLEEKYLREMDNYLYNPDSDGIKNLSKQRYDLSKRQEKFKNYIMEIKSCAKKQSGQQP